MTMIFSLCQANLFMYLYLNAKAQEETEQIYIGIFFNINHIADFRFNAIQYLLPVSNCFPQVCILASYVQEKVELPFQNYCLYI